MLATQEGFEYGVIAADGPASVSAADCFVVACDYAGTGVAGGVRATTGPAAIEPGLLAHLPAGSTSIELSAAGPNRFFVVGGLPLGERLVMWWNFVGRTAEEIAWQGTRGRPETAASARSGATRESLCPHRHYHPAYSSHVDA
jgi:hypothetical protein